MTTAVTDARATTMTAEDVDWWYVRIYPGSGSLMDATTRAVLPWLTAQGDEGLLSTWFFIRYLDITGQHLRVRARGTADQVDALCARTAEVLDLVPTTAEPGSDRILPGAQLADVAGRPRVEPRTYAPELQKYGGLAAVAAAERLFAFSSGWYVSHDVGALPVASTRAALALSLMRACVQNAQDDRVEDFWLEHRRQWGGHLRALVPGRPALEEKLEQVTAAVATVASPVEVGPLAETLALTVREAARHSPVPRSTLVREFLHMEINRLGFPPAEECRLGIIASHSAAGGIDR
jgi:Lantibiotic biosynthesis dehydratase C-term